MSTRRCLVCGERTAAGSIQGRPVEPPLRNASHRGKLSGALSGRTGRRIPAERENRLCSRENSGLGDADPEGLLHCSTERDVLLLLSLDFRERSCVTVTRPEQGWYVIANSTCLPGMVTLTASVC